MGAGADLKRIFLLKLSPNRFQITVKVPERVQLRHENAHLSAIITAPIERKLLLGVFIKMQGIYTKTHKL